MHTTQGNEELHLSDSAAIGPYFAPQPTLDPHLSPHGSNPDWPDRRQLPGSLSFHPAQDCRGRSIQRKCNLGAIHFDQTFHGAPGQLRRDRAQARSMFRSQGRTTPGTGGNRRAPRTRDRPARRAGPRQRNAAHVPTRRGNLSQADAPPAAAIGGKHSFLRTQ